MSSHSDQSQPKRDQSSAKPSTNRDSGKTGLEGNSREQWETVLATAERYY